MDKVTFFEVKNRERSTPSEELNVKCQLQKASKDSSILCKHFHSTHSFIHSLFYFLLTFQSQSTFNLRVFDFTLQLILILTAPHPWLDILHYYFHFSTQYSIFCEYDILIVSRLGPSSSFTCSRSVFFFFLLPHTLLETFLRLLSKRPDFIY